jgi:hypothetical protein
MFLRNFGIRLQQDYTVSRRRRPNFRPLVISSFLPHTRLQHTSLRLLPFVRRLNARLETVWDGRTDVGTVGERLQVQSQHVCPFRACVNEPSVQQKVGRPREMTPNLKTEDVIRCCLLRAVIVEYDARLAWWLAGGSEETRERSDPVSLRPHHILRKV